MKLLNEIPTILNWIDTNHAIKPPRHSNCLARKDKRRCNYLRQELYYIHLKEKSIIPHYCAFVNNDWKESELYLRFNSNKSEIEIRALLSPFDPKIPKKNLI